MNKNIILILFLLFLVACEDENFETPSYIQKIVVDGWIEQGQQAKVFLTLSTPYFSDIDSTSIRKLVLTTAKVTLTDGSISEILTLHSNSDYFPPYVYQSNSIIGTIGHSYSLKIEYGGVTVTSITHIPEPEPIDSIWFLLATGIDTAGYIKISFTDQLNVDNYYRIMTRTGNKTSKYTPVFLPNLDGSLVDGQDITLSLAGEKDDNPLYFNVNDTVNVKLCTIDKAVFKFWNSLYVELKNANNPFAASNTHVISNINGGLGIWAGYGVSTKTIINK